MHRAVRRTEGGGEILPSAFPSLAQAKIHFRRSELALVAAQPGAGKSTFALTLGLRTGVPGLYISADSSARTQAVRILAQLTGRSQEYVEPLIDANPEWASEVLARTGHLKWCFDSAPGLGDVEDELDAFIAAHGAPPQLLVIDNATDIGADGGDEYGSLRALMRDLKYWARYCDMNVTALHHTSEAEPPGGKENAPVCPPRSMIHGKISQVPALVLTLASKPDAGFMYVAPVKNRYGPADPTGHTAIPLLFDPSTMTLNDIRSQ